MTRAGARPEADRHGAIALGLLAGYLLDRRFGDPERGHPVALFGTWAGRVERRLHRDSRAAGIVGEAVTLAPALALGAVAGRRRGLPLVVATAAVTWASLGGTSLGREARAVHDRLAADDLPGARVQVGRIVGRATDRLSADEVARAAIESVAENTSDAVVGTLVWGALAGPSGVVLHRAANTLDAMHGHRSPRFARYGWTAARLDDLLGWLPARVTVLATAVAAGVSAGPQQAAEVVRIAATDGPRHPSPNAGPVEAAFAAALGVHLGGRNDYGGRIEDRAVLGSGPHPVAGDIPRADALASRVGLVVAVAAAGLRLALAARCRARRTR